MITSFEHNYNIGDTVYLIFLSKGKYRVRKKTGYKVEIIRFSLFNYEFVHDMLKKTKNFNVSAENVKGDN